MQIIVAIEALSIEISLEKVNGEYPLDVIYEYANGTQREVAMVALAHHFRLVFEEQAAPWWKIGPTVVQITDITVNFFKLKEGEDAYAARFIFSNSELGKLHEMVLRSKMPRFRISFKNDSDDGDENLPA